MKRSDITVLPEYFDYYINLVADVDLAEAFDGSLAAIDALDRASLQRIGTKPYAAGKWSVHQVVQHLTDWERVWCYRALLAARAEGTVPEGLEQDVMAANGNANELTIDVLLDELRLVRQASKALFAYFSPRILQLPCRFYKYEMSLLATGFSIIGHQVHHFNIIRERYGPLDTQAG